MWRFLNANHLRNDSFEKIGYFQPVFVRKVSVNNNWLNLKIVGFSEKSIFFFFWEILLLSLKWAALLLHSLSLKLELQISNTPKIELKAQSNSHLTYALHYLFRFKIQLFYLKIVFFITYKSIAKQINMFFSIDFIIFLLF